MKNLDSIKADENKPIILMEKRVANSAQFENPWLARRMAIKAAKGIGLK